MAYIDWHDPRSRERERKDRQAELDAIVAGEWPRNINDRMRWKKDDAEYARRMCEMTIALIDDKDAESLRPAAPSVVRSPKKRIRITDSGRFAALVVDSEGRNRGPVPEIVDALDPMGRHLCAFEFVHNGHEMRATWMVKLTGKTEPTVIIMDNDLRLFGKLTSFTEVEEGED